MKRKSIRTVEGEAFYVKTEYEDRSGNWNDNYSVKDGYYVVHEDIAHHIYKVKR